MMKLIHDIGFDNSFSFIFSPRPGTPAANLHDDTPHEVKLAPPARAASRHQRQHRHHQRISDWARCNAFWWKAAASATTAN